MYYSIQNPDENPAWRDIIFNSVLNILTIFIVVLRLCSRRVTSSGFGWDDGFILVATLLVNGMLVLTGSLIYLGFGLPMDKVAPDDFRKIAELGRTLRMLFLLCICCVKLSALFFYLRVFGGSSGSTDFGTGTSLSAIRPFLRRFTCRFSLRFTYISFIYIVIAWSVANIIQEIAVCGPKMPVCVSRRSTDLQICVFNAVGDLLILLLPLWPVWHLKMKTSTKIGVSFLFLLGTVTIIVAFLRFEAIVRTEYGGDYNATGMKAANYAILEPNLAILCMSLPMVQPLLRKAVPYFKSKFQGSFRNWLPRSPIASMSEHWRPRRTSRVFTTAPVSRGNNRGAEGPWGSQLDDTHVDFKLPAIPPRVRPRNDGYRRSGAGTLDRDGDESLEFRTIGLWRTNSRDSQDELVELAIIPAAAFTSGSTTNLLYREDWPLPTPTGMSRTTMGASW